MGEKERLDAQYELGQLRQINAELVAACEAARVELVGWIKGNVALDAPDTDKVLALLNTAIARAKGATP